MAKNPLSEQEWSKLKASIAWSERQLEFPKRKRLQAIRQFAGYHYADGASQKRVPVPMLALAVQIYIRQLAARAPRALVTTTYPELRACAANMELVVNQIPDEIGLAKTLRKFVMEALFSMGVVKVGLCKVGTALGHEYGESFVDLITLDNYFCDMSAKSMEEIDYEGNQYWLDLKEVKDSGWLDGKDAKDLRPDEYTVVGVAGEPRAEEVSVDSSADQYRDRVWLRDIWLPREGLVLTAGAMSNTLLNVVEWDGPKNGPYPKLGFSDVPGNLLALAPVSLWRDLHELSNTLFRKLGNEAESYKSVMGFTGGDDESVDNFKKAQDGEGIRYSGADPRKLETSGVDQKTLMFYLQCRDLFSYFAGNLDNLGGLQNNTPTLGQDKLMSAAASAQMQDMSDMTMGVIKVIFESLAFYEWNDPVKKRRLKKPIPGTDLSVTIDWNHKSKKGKWDSYDLDIDMYSMQDNSPGVRLQKLGQIMQQYIMPLAPQIQQAGGTIDVQKILKFVGKYADLPELEEIVIFADSSTTPQQPQAAGGPANTSHTSTRIGQPGASNQGADAALIQSLSGGGQADAGSPTSGS